MEIRLVAKRNHFVPISIITGLMIETGAFWALIHRQPRLLCLGLAAVGILFFVLARELSIHARSLVTMDESGFLDSRLGIGKIAWSDIDHVNMELNYGHRALSFRVRRADVYLERMTPTRRAEILARRKLGFQRFTVDLRGFDIDPIVLKSQITKMVRNSEMPEQPEVIPPLTYI